MSCRKMHEFDRLGQEGQLSFKNCPKSCRLSPFHQRQQNQNLIEFFVKKNENQLNQMYWLLSMMRSYRIESDCGLLRWRSASEQTSERPMLASFDLAQHRVEKLFYQIILTRKQRLIGEIDHAFQVKVVSSFAAKTIFAFFSRFLLNQHSKYYICLSASSQTPPPFFFKSLKKIDRQEKHSTFSLVIKSMSSSDETQTHPFRHFCSSIVILYHSTVLVDLWVCLVDVISWYVFVVSTRWAFLQSLRLSTVSNFFFFVRSQL